MFGVGRREGGFGCWWMQVEEWCWSSGGTGEKMGFVGACFLSRGVSCVATQQQHRLVVKFFFFGGHKNVLLLLF